MKTLNELFYQVILLNELSGNKSAALRFSDPDGASGRSGWSFGVCQFDTKHNGSAISCLVDCGFRDGEIKGIVNQTVDVKPFAARLIAHASTIEKYDTEQLTYCLNNALNAITSKGVMAYEPAALLCLADYVNQYGSIGPAFIEWMNQRDSDGITAAEIQEWKLNHTKYGREHTKDCIRRYNNILKVLANA
ncbi:MAG: hypothetical protein PHI31_09845 [Desulfuromonadaceae bacterium]|nr:hypothetical protein [Desulfuromonadaceae bacterium]